MKGWFPGKARREMAEARRIDGLRKAVLVPAHRVVVKVGSSLLAPEGRRIRRGRIGSLASQVASLRAAGRQVIIVSSGAIASGMQVLALRHRPAAVEQKQALAAVGQPELMRAWGEALRRHGLRAAQVLLTADDLQARSRCLNARRALAALLERGLVPVVNENDVVAVEEIRMGDNDSLSALVALFCGADALVLVTEWNEFREPDFARMRKLMRAPVIFDGRNLYSKDIMRTHGFTYFSIGVATPSFTSPPWMV